MKKALITTMALTATIISIIHFSQGETKSERQDRIIKEQVQKSMDKYKDQIDEVKKKKQQEAKPEESLDKSALFKKMNKAIELERKVLRSVEERKTLQDTLSDMELVNQAADIVMDSQNVSEANLSENQKERMNAVLFLVRTLEWPENPKRQEIMNKTTEMVLKENLGEIKNIEVRKSFAADKLELFVTIKENDFERGLKIEDQNQSERIAKLFRFANNFYSLNKKGDK